MSDPEVFSAIYEMAAKEISGDLKYNWDRFPIVINKYGEKCKEQIEFPHRRFLFWLKKEGLSMKTMTETELDRIFGKAIDENH